MIKPRLIKCLCVKELKQIAMNKRVYEAPVTERFQVELEGVFCSSIFNEVTPPGTIEASGHGVNDNYDAIKNPHGWGDFNDQFSSTGWE